MSEETATLTPSEQREAIVITQDDMGRDTKEATIQEAPFFEKEISEAELMGEPGEPEKKSGDDSTDTEKKPEVIKEEGKEVTKEAEPVKPPPGFVPKGALHEEREKRKELQATIDDLRKQLEGKPEEQDKSIAKTLGLPEDFKILTDEEEDALMEEDLFAYQKYQRNLRKYERGTFESSKKEQVAAEINRRATTLIEGAVRRMEASVPGIHEPESEINKSLTEFALSNGFDNEYLNVMTDPKTLILPAGAKQPVYLGDGAASLVELINNTFNSKATIEAKLTKEITEKVTAELMKKFKSPGQTHKSLGDAPGSMSIDVTGGKYTEKDFAKMSEDEQRIALGG
ncbi:MAG: hypothetical protein M0R00_01380 [Candidatus Omnitrophica bacterium]|jgi:hypothetical protein|nr:hypothetical protein [Candidatus Omnitrophota bacterium]